MLVGVVFPATDTKVQGHDRWMQEEEDKGKEKESKRKKENKENAQRICITLHEAN